MLQVRSLKLGERSEVISTIKLSGHEADIKAVYALLGGYNEVARSVDVDEFHELQKEFKKVVGKLSDKLLLG